MRNIIALLLVFLTPIILFSQTDDCSCCSDQHAAFDFWVGTWNVTNPDGSIAGKNVIGATVIYLYNSTYLYLQFMY